MLVVEDVQRWWSKTGIKIKSPHGILYMIDRLVKNYINLEKSKKREGKAKINREKFLDELETTLWVVDKDTEESLRTSKNSKCIQDWLYLEKVQGKNKLASLGSVDTQDLKKIKRKGVRE